MNRTSKKWAVAVAAAAVALATGGAVASAGSAAAPSATGGASVRAHEGWPVSSDLSARQVMREARAAARDDGGRFMTFIEVVRRFRAVDVGTPGDSPGDSLLWESAVFTRGGDRVGRDFVQCMFGIRTYTCTATLQLNGRGKIMVYGTFFDNEPQIAITGGTRDFRDARGQLFAIDQPDGTTRLVFQLVD